jgi:hypothetical protein
MKLNNFVFTIFAVIPIGILAAPFVKIACPICGKTATVKMEGPGDHAKYQQDFHNNRNDYHSNPFVEDRSKDPEAGA